MAIEFVPLNIKNCFGPKRRNVYYVKDNGRSVVMDHFSKLDYDTKYEIITLINKLSTVEGKLNSKKIRHSLKNYPNLAEIIIDYHRFFYFTVLDNNIIFFDYHEKKKDALPTDVLNNIDKKRDKYEKEFRRNIFRNS